MATPESERAVAIAWQRVLGVAPVAGVSFLEVSGDSLQLLTFVFALESRVGRTLPLEGFDADLDAGGMAATLDTILAGEARSGEGRVGDDVFLFPGARGDTPGLAGMRADCLAGGGGAMTLVGYPDWRAMASGALAGGEMGFDGIVAAALEQMPKAGAVTLVAYSMGVRVATAVAFALEAEGRVVRRLVVMDLAAPRWAGRAIHVWDLPRGLRDAWWEVNRLRRGGAERVGMMLARGAASGWARTLLCRASGWTWWATQKAWGGDVGYWTGHHLGQELRLRASAAGISVPPGRRLQAPVALIRTDAHGVGAPEDLGWGEVAEVTSVVRVGGDHVSMLSSAHRGAVSAAVMAALE